MKVARGDEVELLLTFDSNNDNHGPSLKLSLSFSHNLQLYEPDEHLSLPLDIRNMEDKVASALGSDSTDYWASPTTQVFAFIGILWLSYQIFSFWRMIASLFILPGASVSPSRSASLTHRLEHTSTLSSSANTLSPA